MEEIELSRRTVLQAVGAGTIAAIATVAPAGSAAAGSAGAGRAAAPGQPLPEPLRTLTKPNLVIGAEPAATILGRRHRVDFYSATWDGGRTYVRALSVRTADGWRQVTDPDRLFDEQWVVLTSDKPGAPADYYASTTPNWVSFDAITIDGQAVELDAVTTDRYRLTVRWSLRRDNPELRWTLTAQRAGHFVVGYQSFDCLQPEQVDEVLCGTRQHARVIDGADALGAWELMAPMSLIQRDIDQAAHTLGVFIPASAIAFEHERELHARRQRFAMSLRNEARDVQPVVYAPQAGERSACVAGETLSYVFGVYAAAAPMADAYADLARHEYGHRDYRHNAYNTSLTATMLNLINLAMGEPDRNDSETFVASPSGWWNRAKGYIDVENDQAIRTATAGVLLSAYYLTGDRRIYDRRARPIMEYQLSRTNFAFTPIKGKPIYGDRNLYKLGGVAGDASTLVPLYQQSRGQNSGLHALAMQSIRQRTPRDSRTPMSTPLQAYELTGNPAYLAEARAEGLRYIRTQIEPLYTTNVPENAFQYHYVKAWTELLLLFERTGDEAFLTAAYAEARRFITQTHLRPVPDISLKVPTEPVLHHQFDAWGVNNGIWDYPLTEEPTERVPAWLVSTNGMSFEQLSTYKIGDQDDGLGGFSLNPCWAPFLLRLAAHVDDKLLADVAHNLVIGRYTNYPGYYNRQFSSWQIRPDFPLVGPPGVSCIYYHHIPAQLAMTIDYLISEHTVRSGHQIDFPAQFETNYVFFKYRTYGHAPGRFYGEDGVWLHLPEDIVKVSNPQFNWITAEGNGNLYLSLTSESDDLESANVTFEPRLAGVDPAKQYAVEVIRDNGRRSTTRMRGGKFAVEVSGKGITAVIVRGVDLNVPLHALPDTTDNGPGSYHFDDTSPIGMVRGQLLVRPDRTGYDAYIYAATEQLATLRYSLDGGTTWQETATRFYPNEWTIPVDRLAAPLSYTVSAGGVATSEATLRLPPSLTGVCPPMTSACGAVTGRADTTPADTMRVSARVHNGSATAFVAAKVALALPAGWTAVPVGTPPVEVPAGGSALWPYDVTTPADAPPGTVSVGGSATWTGGAVELAPAPVEVLAPLSLPAISVARRTLANPGDSTTVTVSALNVGPVRRSGTLSFTVNHGWTATPASLTYDVAGRSEQSYTVALSSSTTVQREFTYGVRANLDTGAQIITTVRIAGDYVVVDNADPWPRYVETGSWLPSGLAGFNRTSTRFSELGVLGGTATWRPSLPRAGRYEVAVWYPTNPETTRAAVYVVQHLGGESTFTVDQQDQANGWRVLGVFDFAAGDDGYVQLQVRNSGYHRADAARFRPVTE